MNPNASQAMNNDPLKSYIDAVHNDTPDATTTDAAQRRLMTGLDAKTSSTRSQSGGWGLRATAAAALAVLILPVLLLVPGSNGGVAFADIQAFFNDFRTMHARMTTSMNGNEIMTVDVYVDDQDRARVDSGGIVSLIVDPNRQEMLQLFHSAGRAALVPLTDEGTQDEETGLEWLEDIREYQGQARLIDETRVIGGEEVFGFRLTQRAIDMTLWATDSGKPVLLEMDTGSEAAPITTRIQFEFDGAVDAERFSLEVPAGYEVETR
jgi:outer membrane lipoprotein-sorting protein